MQETVNVTSAGTTPAEDRQDRTRKYLIAMLVRTVCVFLMLIVPGWWAVIPALGAILLPYFAVMVANIAAPQTAAQVPEVLPLSLAASAPASTADSGQQLIIVDSFADRQAKGERISD